LRPIFLWRRSGDPLGRGQQSFALRQLPSGLAGPPHCLRFFPYATLRRLFVSAPRLHFPKYSLALKFALQCFKRLFDVVVANQYLQVMLLSENKKGPDTRPPLVFVALPVHPWSA